MKQSTRDNPHKPRTAGKIISTVVIILLFTFAAVCGISVLTTKYIYHRPAALFGYRIVKIVTDSMSPQIPVGSYILVKNIEGSQVKEGDIVVHIPAYGPYAGLPMTHLCIEGPHDVDGQTCITTQGTKEGAPVDPPVPIANVQSVYVRSVAKAGGLFDFMTSKWGVIVLVAIPCLVVVLLQIGRMVRAVVAKPDEDKVKEEAERIEKERNDAQKQEVLGALQGGSGKSAAAEFGDVMAYIAREKAKNTSVAEGDATPPADDEMSSVMAFIARQKAQEDKDDKKE